jgi:hypothetical protein
MMNYQVRFTSSFSKLHSELRKEKEVFGWREASLYHGNYTCLISGRKNNLAVHHLYSFESIVKDTINELIEENKLDDHWLLNPYVTMDIKERFLHNHKRSGLGVVLHKKIHDEFHRIFKRKNNTCNQFEEFKSLMTVEKINQLMEIPADYDLVCSKCKRITELLIGDTCPSC